MSTQHPTLYAIANEHGTYVLGDPFDREESERYAARNAMPSTVVSYVPASAMDDRRAEIEALREQLATLTKERDALTVDRDDWRRKALMDPTGLSSLLYRDQYKELSEVNFKHMQERDEWKAKAEAAEEDRRIESMRYSDNLACEDMVKRRLTEDRDAARARVAELEAGLQQVTDILLPLFPDEAKRPAALHDAARQVVERIEETAP